MQRPVFYIISVLIVTQGYDCPVYYVSTNGGVSCFVSYDKLPDMVKHWLELRNDPAYAYRVLSSGEFNALLITDGRVY